MKNLNILPIEYPGKRIEELGENLVRVYYPVFQNFKIISPISRNELKEMQAKKRFSKNNEFWINGKGFCRFLEDNGNYILGITALPVARNKRGGWKYGGGSWFYKSAFVSAFRPEFGEIDSDINLERTTIESIHEIGHAFGLRHHPEKTLTENLKLCPMDVSLNKDALNKKITWEEYISSRDSESLCKECYSKLVVK
jgi:predicted Zn-dependent protease